MTHPNILLITCDQLRCDALGCYDNPVIKTPHIDQLAKDGIRFDQTFTASPVCSPNRASMATGRYPSVHGLRTNGLVLPDTELTFMEVLRLHGYATYASGKMHFGPQWRFPPNGEPFVNPTPDLAVNPQPSPEKMPWYGFEKVAITEDNRVGPYADYLTERGYDVWADPHSFSYPQHACVRSVCPEEHSQTAWTADQSISFINEHDNSKPLFCWTSFVHPHHPFNPPAPYDTMYDPKDMPLPAWRDGEDALWPKAYIEHYTRTKGSHEAIGMFRLTDADWQRVKAYYYGMISLIDKQVGRLKDALRKQGMLDNTIIVFTSDHGEMLGDHHMVFKGSSYDCVTRVPMIITRPDKSQAGHRREALANSIDLMPTILDLANAPIPPSVQGQSLVGVMDDPKQVTRDAVLIEHPFLRRSVRTDDALLTWHGENTCSELYDLILDPDCQKNLWGQSDAKQLQDKMLHKLIRLMVNYHDPLPLQVGPC
ncbi:MAG: sulfatase-like hydrolase/transferase [Phycisphaeraceae bacterium]|nr:sulfatase-like hydrolase/transferase [Phycisphaeraceae bacterium]